MSELRTLAAELDGVLAGISASKSPLGTVAHIDSSSIARAAMSVRAGRSIGLGRPLIADAEIARDGEPRVSTETFVVEHGRVSLAFDRISAWPHGFSSTHLDAPNHVGLDGRWYPDQANFEDAPAVDTWSQGIVARGILVNVPASRSEEFVSSDRPVTAAEVGAIVESVNVELQRGDAVILYLGRDRLEELVPGAALYPAVAPDVASWLVDLGVSVLCWDLLDGPVHDHTDFGVHFLVRTEGLALVDNCNLGPLAAELGRLGRADCMLVIAPLFIPGATSSLVNPIAVF